MAKGGGHMAFLSSLLSDPHFLRSGPVSLRHPRMADYEAWSDLRRRSREFLERWEPLWPADDLTRTSFRLRLKRYQRDVDIDCAYPFFIFIADGAALAGGINLSNVRRGVSQTATVGYWMGAPFAGQGIMTHALRAVTAFSFNELQLHRLEAACLPVNEPSMRLLRKCGFEEEGYARRYLKIHGRWQDHRLFGLSAED
jgi:ribosomal-protein-alanine N-acetyltransferase